MKQILPCCLVVALALPGCAMVDRVIGRHDRPAAAAASTLPGGAGAKTAAELDQSSAADKAAALSAPPSAAERELGQVVVALGSPAEQGFWLKSPLVSAAAKGRVVVAGGASVAVDLRPGDGGATLSLAAFRALGLSLTALPQVTVYAN